MLKNAHISLPLGLLLACYSPYCQISALADTAAVAIESDDQKIVDQAKIAADASRYEEATVMVRPLAEKGFAPAQNLLGDLTRVAGDDVKSVEWYRKAAEQGNAKGQNNLGMSLVNGQGVAKNNEEAISWLTKAAEQGHPKAQNNLSVMYATGRGVTKDTEMAQKWRLKAAEGGDPAAQCNVANYYATAKNYTEAFRWLKKAAEQKYGPAESRLGEMYESGLGIEKNHEEAVRIFKVASEAGSLGAAIRLLSFETEAQQTKREVIFLNPGKSVTIEFDLFEGKLKNARLIAPPKIAADQFTEPGKTNTIDISMRYDESHKATFLQLRNNFTVDVTYDCFMRVPGGSFESTNVLPVSAKIQSFEMWPYAIEQMMLGSIQAKSEWPSGLHTVPNK
ncbi:hypothetical protein BH11CYA1_BH11CYA1_24010 [soil metagenome]